MIKKWTRSIKNFLEYLKKEKQLKTFIPIYKVAEIIQNEENDYTIVVQVINKHIVFHAKPEEILADDMLVDQFAPRDVRTLTYLGYLGINAPKYKILAKKLSMENDKIIFALKKRGDKHIITKTADQILNEKNILTNMHPDDAKIIGYTVATEDIQDEKKQKENLLKNLNIEKNAKLSIQK